MKKKSNDKEKRILLKKKILFYRRLKEIMRIMGLKDSVHWLTWFVLCTVIMIVNAILLILILKVNPNFNENLKRKFFFSMEK